MSRTAVLLAGVAVLVSSCGWSLWDSPMTTVRPRSDFGKWIDEIFMLISWITLVIFILVEGALVYACWRFRDRPGAPIPKQVHGHTVLEISWTIAFAVILLIIGIPTIRIIFKTQEAPAATDLRVDVAGKQWWWEFTYPEFKITTANELHIPVGQTVAFYLHAPDVIHSFWMPALGGKRDVVPHRINRIILTPEVPGEYRRPVRRVLRDVARQHALPRDRAPQGRVRAVGQEPAGAPGRVDGSRWRSRARRCSRSRPAWDVTPSRASSAGQIGPNLTHFGSRKSLAGEHDGQHARERREVDREPRPHEARGADAQPRHDGRAVARRSPPTC